MNQFKTIYYKLLCAVLLIVFTLTASAQKVALVLSGGGAKGVTHIGVLKALEEQGIPIDYIAGTSMGAIIGGLYASGYSPDEIQKLINSPDFPYWVTGKVDSRYTYYFKKSRANPSWINFKFRLDSIFETKLPTNIVSPINMDFAFMEIFSSASAASDYDFDSLYIPFRCVASDIVSNKEVAFRKGDIGKAIRASMTFPFYFKPIRIDGKLLFDGGMYNNFPSNVVFEDFNPDIIIGSKAASNYGPPNEDDVISQIQTMLMEKTDYDVICENGILIEPKLKTVNVIDFSNTEAFIDSGYVAALRKIPEIRRFVTDTISMEARNKQRQAFNSKKKPLMIEKLQINGLNKNQEIYVKRQLLHKSHNISLSELKSEYFKLLADDKIDYVYPSLQYDKLTNFYTLNLDVKKDKNFSLQYGGQVSSSPVNEAFIELQYKYLGQHATSIFANTYIGRFYNSVQLRSRLDFPMKLPFYIEADLTYNQWNFFKTSNYFYEDKTPSYLIENEEHARVSVGIPASRQGKLIFDAAYGHIRDDYYQTNIFARRDTVDKTFFDFFTNGLLFEKNSLNQKQFAKSGGYFSASFRQILGEEKNVPGSTSLTHDESVHYHRSYQLRIKYDNYFENIRGFKLGFYSEICLSNQRLLSNYTSSQLAAPAFQPVPECKSLFQPKYRAFNFGGVGLKVIYNIYKNIDYRLEGYMFQPYQEILRNEQNYKAYYGPTFDKRYFIASTSVVYSSPLGPLSVSLNYYDKNSKSFSCVVSFGYIIFNSKANE